MSGVQIPLPRPKELAKGKLRSANRIAGGKHGLLRTSHLAPRPSHFPVHPSHLGLLPSPKRLCRTPASPTPQASMECGSSLPLSIHPEHPCRSPTGGQPPPKPGRTSDRDPSTESGSKLPQSKAASPRCRSSTIQTSGGSSDSDLAPVGEGCRGHRDQRRNPRLPVRCGEPADQDNERGCHHRSVWLRSPRRAGLEERRRGDDHFYWGIGEKVKKVSGGWTRLHRTVSGAWVGDGLESENVIPPRSNGGNGEITPTPRNTASCDVLSVPGRLGQGPSREIPAAR